MGAWGPTQRPVVMIRWRPKFGLDGDGARGLPDEGAVGDEMRASQRSRRWPPRATRCTGAAVVTTRSRGRR